MHEAEEHRHYVGVVQNAARNSATAKLAGPFILAAFLPMRGAKFSTSRQVSCQPAPSIVRHELQWAPLHRQPELSNKEISGPDEFGPRLPSQSEDCRNLTSRNGN
jgi:hypothetical protein